MTKNEGILFKQMDSDWTKPGRICFHMSVKEPEDKPSAPPRESIELRFLCFWKKANVDSMATKENTNAKLIKNPVDLSRAKSISNISTWNILEELFNRIISLWSFGLLGKSSRKSSYTGKPEDYLEQFITLVNSYPKWPSFAKQWISGQMKGEDIESGIAKITQELVNDSMGYQKTRGFTAEEKKEIVDFLLANPEYSKVSKKHWSELV